LSETELLNSGLEIIFNYKRLFKFSIPFSIGPSFRAGCNNKQEYRGPNPEKFIMNLQIFQDLAIICGILFETRPKGRAYS